MSSIKKELDSILGSDKIDRDTLAEYTRIRCDIAMFNPRDREPGNNFIVTIFQNVFKDPIIAHIFPEIRAINILIENDSEVDKIHPHLENILTYINKVKEIYNQLLLESKKKEIKGDDDFEENKELLKSYNFDQKNINFKGVCVKSSTEYIKNNVLTLKRKVDRLANYYNGEYEKWSLNSIWYWTGGWFSTLYNWGANYEKMRDIYKGFSKVHIGSISIDIHANIQNLNAASKILDLQVKSTNLIQGQNDVEKIRIYVDNLERQLSTFFERLYIND